MGDIYSEAKIMIAWLDHGDDDLFDGIRFLQNNLNRLMVFKRGETSSILLELALLYTHPYWRRLWIMQEIVLAKDINLWCGSMNLDLHSLRVGFMCTIYSGSDYLDHTETWPAIPLLLQHQWRLPGLNKDVSQETSDDFCRLLKDAAKLSCLDPRDRIFGVLSLRDHEQRATLDIRPDYSQSREALLRNISLRLWKSIAHYDPRTFALYFGVLFEALEVAPQYSRYLFEIPQLFPKPIYLRLKDAFNQISNKWLIRGVGS